MTKLNVRCPTEIGPYLFKGPIGDGAFSEVRLVEHKESGQFYACKIVPKSRLNSASLETRFEIEIRINQQLHHPGVVQMIDLYCDELNYYVIMEFCPNGDLFQYVVDRDRLSEDEAKPIIKQILETMNYIHSMGVSHRDMKPENILIDQLGRIKISDFGLSRFFGKNKLVNTPCGSPCYASPECISGRPYNGITTDIWSCGVILYAMLTGQLPWTKRNQTQLFQQIKRGEYSVPSYISPEGQNMIKSLMTVNIENRYTADMALKDPWLKGVPMQFNSSEQKGYVSMKQVDAYFGKEVSYLDLKLPVRKCVSKPKLDFLKIYREIIDQEIPLIPRRKKRNHRRNSDADPIRKSSSKKSSNKKAKNLSVQIPIPMSAKHQQEKIDTMPEIRKSKRHSGKRSSKPLPPHSEAHETEEYRAIKRSGRSRRKESARPSSAAIMPGSTATKKPSPTRTIHAY